jgi:hypothetical protein
LVIAVKNAPRYCGHKPTIIIEGVTMQIQFEQLLNLPDIQILNVEIIEHEIKCDIECALMTQDIDGYHGNSQRTEKRFPVKAQPMTGITYTE